MFGKKHRILELPSIPRQRNELQALINTARAEHRKSMLMRTASAIIFGIALMIMANTLAQLAPPAVPTVYSILIPLVSIGY